MLNDVKNLLWKASIFEEKKKERFNRGRRRRRLVQLRRGDQGKSSKLFFL